MADSKQITVNPLAQTANPQQVGRPVPLGDRELELQCTPTARTGDIGGGEGNCPLWDGYIIDATFPLV